MEGLVQLEARKGDEETNVFPSPAGSRAWTSKTLKHTQGITHPQVSLHLTTKESWQKKTQKTFWCVEMENPCSVCLFLEKFRRCIFPYASCLCVCVLVCQGEMFKIVWREKAKRLKNQKEEKNSGDFLFPQSLPVTSHLTPCNGYASFTPILLRFKFLWLEHFHGREKRESFIAEFASKRLQSVDSKRHCFGIQKYIGWRVIFRNNNKLFERCS